MLEVVFFFTFKSLFLIVAQGDTRAHPPFLPAAGPLCPAPLCLPLSCADTLSLMGVDLSKHSY